MADERLAQASQWLNTVWNHVFEIKPLAGDASFRRYFRVYQSEKTYVLMDAPPEKEDVTPFLNVCAWLQSIGMRVPKILAKDLEQGFLLLEDFADQTWSTYLASGGEMQLLFADALRQLHILQSAKVDLALPVFDIARMQRECDLYLDWYLPKVMQYVPTVDERKQFHADILPYLKHLSELPQAAVHLDYHSRNLMLPTDGLPLGVIDFQDAVIGPITYDLASLLYDCYQDYPEHLRRQYSDMFFHALPKRWQLHFEDSSAWHKSLRITAFQRHLKAMGIFARLAYRDGKKQFLEEIPLTRKHFNDEITYLDIPASLKHFLQCK